MKDNMILIILVGFKDLFPCPETFFQYPSIQKLHLLRSNTLFIWRKVINIRQDKSPRISDLTVSFNKPLQGLLSETRIFFVIEHRYPKPKDFGSILRNDFFRVDEISKGFRHSLSVLIQDKAMGYDGLVWRSLFCSNSHEKRAVEPTSVLVMTLHIDVRWPG